MAATIVFHIAIGIFAMFMGRASGECCPTFWTPFGESCYRLVAKSATWKTAEAKCQELGSNIPGMEGHLVSIHTQEENDFVQKYYDGMYESTAIVKGRRNSRKVDRKPTTYNGFWLGLNNQGKAFDDFVWSDNTEMSSTYWQDTVYKKINKCGHTWTSPSKLKGQWNAARCSTKLPFMCKLLPIAVPDESVSESYSLSSSTGLLPCSYRGRIILHSEVLVLDECTSCRCDNSTVKCDIKSCQPTFCEEPISFEGECCDFCPYDVAVYDVELIGVESVKSGTASDIRVDLQLNLNRDAQGVDGENLWKVSMWGSSSEDGQGKRIGFTEQVLTEGQASKQLARPPIFGGFDFTIPDIEFSLDASGASCEEVKYLCASFNMNDAPDPQDPRIPFNVYGVESENDLSPNSARLVGCQPFTYCEADRVSESYSSSVGLLPCSYRGSILLHGDVMNIDECTICGCDNSTVKCDIRSCQPTFCEEPISFEGECCDVCPYDVPVYDVELIGVESVKSGTASDIRVDLQLNLNMDAQSVEGENLWKVSMWGSRSKDGRGNRIGFKEQVLTEEQARTQLVRPPIFGGFDFTIADIEFSLDTSGASCKEVKYLCASFNMNDTPDPQDPRIPFNVYGVESEHNSNQNPARLVGCQPFTYCKDYKQETTI